MRIAMIAALVLAGAAPAAHDRAQDDLARILAGRVAEPPLDCVSIEQTSSLRPVDAQTLSVDRGATLYVNRLAAPCPGLEPTATLIVETQGSRYCRGDHFRTRPFGGSAVPGPICFLGDFVPYRRAR
jgi:hypothetical protein